MNLAFEAEISRGRRDGDAMMFFPLAGKKWNEEKAALAKRHEEKEAAFEQEVLKKQAEEAKASAGEAK